MWLRVALVIVVAGAASSRRARADERPVVALPAGATERPLAEIQVVLHGARRTAPEAIRRMMNTRVGEPMDADILAHDLSRLRATHMLYDTQARVEETVAGPRLVLALRDKWSAFGYAGLRRGGARTISRIGLADNNALGRLFQLSGELNSSADVPFVSRGQGDRLGSALHLATPRLFGSRLTPSLSWVREFFDFAAWGRDGAAGVIYDRQRWLYRAGLRWDVADSVALTFRAAHFVDHHTLGDATVQAAEPPPSLTTTTGGVELQVGEIDEHLSRYQGWLLTAQIDGARRGVLGTDASVVTGTVGGKLFLVPRDGHNLAVQLVLAATTGRTDSHLLRAGGLYEIRGFRDSFFVAQQMGRANVEYRMEAARLEQPFRAIAQVVAFIDGGWTGARAGAVSGLAYSGPVVSAGTGVRCNIVPLARAVGRVDFAFGLHPVSRFEISFGMQQFF